MSAIAIIRTLLLPPLSLFLLYGIGAILHKHRLGRVLRISAIALLLILSTQAGTWLLVRPLENLARPLDSTIGAQAIVVLAAGRLNNSSEYGNSDIPDYIALGRLRYTARLHRLSGLPVLVSGGMSIPEEHRPALAEGMASALQDDFATPVKWQEKQSSNTTENAIYSAQILKQAGIKRILLVTDAMHMRRASMMFEHAGMEVIAAPTLFFSKDEWSLDSLIPNVEHMRLCNYAIYEWLGIAWYKMKYGIWQIA